MKQEPLPLPTQTVAALFELGTAQSRRGLKMVEEGGREYKSKAGHVSGSQLQHIATQGARTIRKF